MAQGLARRVADRQQGTVEMRPERTLAEEIRAMEQQFQIAMPRGAEAAQLIRDALTMLRKVPKLAQCEAQSVLGALMTCAQLNLRVGVLGQAWVLPFWNKTKRRFEAQLIIGYQGHKELALRSGQVASVIARTRHEHDLFDIDYGTDYRLSHKPALNGPRGPIVGYYSIVRYINGGYEFWYMSQDEVDEHRDLYAMTRDKDTGKVFGVWIDSPEGMALKTVFLKIIKWAPKSTEMATAIAADGTVRVDLSPNNDAALYGERPDDAIDGELTEDDTTEQPSPPQPVADLTEAQA